MSSVPLQGDPRSQLNQALHAFARQNSLPREGYALIESVRAMLQRLLRLLLDDHELVIVTSGSAFTRTALLNSDADFEVHNTVTLSKRVCNHVVEVGVQLLFKELGLPLNGTFNSGRTASSFRLREARDGEQGMCDCSQPSPTSSRPAHRGDRHETKRSVRGQTCGSSGSSGGGSGGSSSKAGGSGDGKPHSVISFDLIYDLATFGRPSRMGRPGHRAPFSWDRACNIQRDTRSNQAPVRWGFGVQNLVSTISARAFRTAAKALRCFIHTKNSMTQLESYKCRALVLLAGNQLMIKQQWRKSKGKQQGEGRNLQQRQRQQLRPISALDVFERALRVLQHCRDGVKLHDELARFVSFPTEAMFHRGGIINFSNVAKHMLATLHSLARSSMSPSELLGTLGDVFTKGLRQAGQRSSSQPVGRYGWVSKLAAQLADKPRVTQLLAHVSDEVQQQRKVAAEERAAAQAAKQLAKAGQPAVPKKPKMKHSKSAADRADFTAPASPRDARAALTGGVIGGMSGGSAGCNAAAAVAATPAAEAAAAAALPRQHVLRTSASPAQQQRQTRLP
ncbi:MAG: hypothetical protein WDW38_009553 [Sanguina aurantia]